MVRQAAVRASFIELMHFYDKVTDLTPNVGLFWYLMTEIFVRFRTFFLLLLHSIPVALVVPLTLCFW